MPNSRLLFIYGTLMRGQPNTHLLAGAEYIKEVVTVPRYRLLDLEDYPGLRAGGQTSIKGELWRVPDEMLEALDAFEGKDYRRELVRADGGYVDAYFYRGDTTRFREIASGDWRYR